MESWISYCIALGCVLVFFLGGLFARRIIFMRLSKAAARTEWPFDDILIKATRGPFIFWVLLIGLFVAMKIVALPYAATLIINKSILAILIISVTFVISNIISQLITQYSASIEGALPLTGLTRNIAKGSVIGMGALILLHTLGISITPILTTMGIGGLAVALGLQETLSNLFAGFSVTMARQIRTNDYVKLASGEEGYIDDIGWRSTKIRTLDNNTILIPNAKLAQTVITNYHFPNKEIIFSVSLSVHYSSDLKKVQDITEEVARDVAKSAAGAVQGFQPLLRYSSFGDSGVNFSVAFKAKEFTDQYLIKHEFIKKLHEIYKKEGIVIPYPTRSVYTEK